MKANEKLPGRLKINKSISPACAQNGAGEDGLHSLSGIRPFPRWRPGFLRASSAPKTRSRCATDSFGVSRPHHWHDDDAREHRDHPDGRRAQRSEQRESCRDRHARDDARPGPRLRGAFPVQAVEAAARGSFLPAPHEKDSVTIALTLLVAMTTETAMNRTQSTRMRRMTLLFSILGRRAPLTRSIEIAEEDTSTSATRAWTSADNTSMTISHHAPRVAPRSPCLRHDHVHAARARYRVDGEPVVQNSPPNTPGGTAPPPMSRQNAVESRVALLIERSSFTA